MKVGVIGIGIMGSAIARNLIAAGSGVAGFDIDKGRLEALRSAGGEALGSAEEVARACEVVLTSLPSAAALDETVAGPRGLLSARRKGQVIADSARCRSRSRSAIERLSRKPESRSSIVR